MRKVCTRWCQLIIFGMLLTGCGLAGAGQATEQGTLGVLSEVTVQEVIAETARPLRIASQIVSVSDEYGAIVQMLSPHRYEETMEDFFHFLNLALERCGDENLEVVEAVIGLLDHQGEYYFGNFREEEIEIFSSKVYDNISRNWYRQYAFFLPDQSKPKACVYIDMEDGYVYGCADNYFWSNDPQAVQMPGVHSCVDEGKLRISDYLETASPGVICEIVYKGLERKDELEYYMQALHYSVSEKHADGVEMVWEAYVDEYLSLCYDGYYFYVETAQNSYEKRQLCTWESEDGHSCAYAFSKAFQKEEDGRWRCGNDWKVTVLKDGKLEESFVLELDVEDRDWYGEMRIDDYNFDGILDIARIWGTPATWGGQSTTIYVRDEAGGYHDAGTFLDVPRRDVNIQTVYEHTRGGYGHYFNYAYQYREGSFACVSSLEEEFMEDGSITYRVRDEAGNEEVYKDELPDKWAELWY